MPVVSLKQTVDRAFDARCGVPAVTVFKDLTMQGVLGLAVEVRSPVIVQTPVKDCPVDWREGAVRDMAVHDRRYRYSRGRELAPDHRGGGTPRKFINDPKQFVPKMLEAIARANPDTLRNVPDYQLTDRADVPNHNKVTIIQGSGHEPAQVMTDGLGMLDGVCRGDVFAAPPIEHTIESSKLLDSDTGVSLVVNNYTGDRMAFEMAEEAASTGGIKVRAQFINDYISVQDSTYTVGRRGEVGNLFVMKAVGAASETGADLNEPVHIDVKVNSVTRTMDVAQTACTPPTRGEPLFEARRRGHRDPARGSGGDRRGRLLTHQTRSTHRSIQTGEY